MVVSCHIQLPTWARDQGTHLPPAGDLCGQGCVPSPVCTLQGVGEGVAVPALRAGGNISASAGVLSHGRRGDTAHGRRGDTAHGSSSWESGYGDMLWGRMWHC